MPGTLHYDITFGDCDPAGIVFYPNTFRWMDAAFDNFLRPAGGHAELCHKLHSVGLGLVDASAQFRFPMRDGDALVIRLHVAEWSPKTMTLAYEGHVGDTLTFKGREVRCLFVRTENGIVTGELSQLRGILEAMDE